MKILNKLSIKDLKLNKKRTISTMLGIILSVALICAVATMFTSFQETLVQKTISDSGYYHLQLVNITDENLKELQSNKDIKNTYSINQIGYAKLENGKNKEKPYLKLISMNKDSFEQLRFKLLQGRFPKDNTEIIISKHIIDNAKVNYKIGDKIKINTGERKTLDNEDLYFFNPYQEGEEEIVNTEEKEYTIVGIVQRPAYSFETFSDPGYSVITTEINTEKKDVYISFNNPKEYQKSICKILQAKNYEEVKSGDANLKYDQYNINTGLLRWEVFAFSDSTVSMLYAVCGIVIFIILFTSIFCIRNSFAIATAEKVKMYAMLASVGATKKQIRQNVIFEAMIVGIIGIPLGILSGIFAVFVLIKILNVLIGEYFLNDVNGFVMHVSLLPILLSVILGIATIYLSARSSVKKASRVSPIEGLRNSNDIKIKNNKLKTPKIISRLFKTGGILAYKNLKRSKKKYRTTVISIAISIFIFITINSFIVNVFDLSDNYYEDYDYNIIVEVGTEDLKQTEINKILSLNSVKEHFELYRKDKGSYLSIKELSKINLEDGMELEEDYYYDKEKGENISTGEGKTARLQLLALDNESFKKYAKKIGTNYEEVKRSGILCDKYQYYDNELKNTKEFRRYKYNKNDIITGKVDNKEVSIKVGDITDIKPYGIERVYYSGGYLIVNLDEHKDKDFRIDTITINSDNPDSLEEEIKNLSLNISVMNMEAQAKEEKSMILVINIFLYGFITVITLIGVTNIFNTITSNMELRQKEFAMLKSIGMTKREFNRMVNLETIFYCVKALIYGIILGLLGTFALYKAFLVKINSGMYIPINPIIISTVAVFILVFVIMKYSIHKINKQNTIETIRKDNI